MTEYTDQDREDLAPWLEMAALRAENERLAAELAASQATETPATEASTTEAPAPAEAAAVPNRDEVAASVDAIPLNQTPDQFYESLAAVGAVATRPAPDAALQLSAEELTAKLDEADNATSPEDFYAKLAEAGAVETSSGRVYGR